MKRASANSPVGKNVRSLRLAAGLTQEQLAEEVDVAPETISRIETGRFAPAHALMLRIAAAVSAEPAMLLSEDPPTHEPRAGLRPSEARLLATVRHLSDSELDSVTRALKLLLALPRTSAET